MVLHKLFIHATPINKILLSDTALTPFLKQMRDWSLSLVARRAGNRLIYEEVLEGLMRCFDPCGSCGKLDKSYTDKHVFSGVF